MNLLGICGERRHGKDECGIALVKQGWTVMRMADPLRAALLKLDPWVFNGEKNNFIYLRELVDRADWEGAKRCSYDVRRYMQRLGTEVLYETFSPYMLVNKVFYAKDGVLTQMNKGQRIVITDVRRQNEVNEIHALGGKVIWVHRPDFEQLPDMHVTEQPQNLRSDWTIMNNGTVDELHQKIINLVERMQASDEIAKKYTERAKKYTERAKKLLLKMDIPVWGKQDDPSFDQDYDWVADLVEEHGWKEAIRQFPTIGERLTIIEDFLQKGDACLTSPAPTSENECKNETSPG